MPLSFTDGYKAAEEKYRKRLEELVVGYRRLAEIAAEHRRPYTCVADDLERIIKAARAQ